MSRHLFITATLAATMVLAGGLSGCGRLASVLPGRDRGHLPPPAAMNPLPASVNATRGAAANRPAGPSLQAINAGLVEPTDDPPRFVGQPVASDGDRPARFVGVMNLYGEMPGAGRGLPEGALDNLRQVSFATEGADFDAAISPDGNYLVYASTQHRPTADLYLKRIDGQTVTQLTADPANDTMPAVSPDGKRIAFASDRSGNWDIYMLATDGGQPVQLTQTPSHELHPSWSADGRQLVISSLGEQSGQWEMVVIDVDNPARRQFIGYGLFPEFSPDGKKIAYQRARYRGSRWFSLWTLDYANGEAARPTQIAASSNSAVITPTWSPDSRRLAFATVVDPRSVDPNARPRQADVWMIDLDGTGRVRLTRDRFVNLQPTWGKDGWVYFVSNRTGVDNLWAVRADERSVVDADDGPDADTQASVPTD